MLLLVFSAALICRLIAINQSLWLDEAISLNVVRNYSFFEIINKFSPSDFHPPGYYLLLKLWTAPFSISVISGRLLSIFLSLAAGFYFYHLVRFIKDRRAAVWALSLFLFNPLIIYYSHEIRMYSLVVFLLTAATFYFIKILNSPQIKLSHLFLFSLFSGLAFLTFYGSVFLIVSFYVFVFFDKNHRYLFPKLLPGFVISLLIIFPLLVSQYKSSSLMLSSVKNWTLVLGQVTLKNLLLIPIKFITGRVTFYPKVLYYLISGLSVIVTFFIASTGFLKNKLVLFLFFFPIFIATLFSFTSPMLQYFRFLYLIPIMCLALSFADRRHLSLVLVIFVSFSFFYLFDWNQHREDWKDLASSIDTQKPVLIISSFADPLSYYSPQAILIDYRNTETLAAQNQVTVVPYGQEIHGLNHSIILQNLGFHQQEIKNFRGLTSEIWTR